MALRLRGSTDGYAEIDASAQAGNVTLTLPSTAGEITVKDASGNTSVGDGVNFGNPGTNIFTINTGGSERLRIGADGAVSIGGTLTYEDVTSVDAIGLSTFRDGLNTKDVGLTEISSTNVNNSGTAVDIFIYDTSTDSDGGEWRKRTSHTSWYNESLQGPYRGIRKEFPAVAVIVAETDKVTIYDGDDPDLPMWMVFNRSSSTTSTMLASNATSPTSLYMKNGILCVTFNTGGWGISEIRFVDDSQRWIWGNYPYPDHRQIANTIVERDVESGYEGPGAIGGGIVVGYANDVAMTVLPNALIDDATGLPVPTIAVATNAGTSIIRDDGTIIDITPYSDEYVAFDNNNLIIGRGDGSAIVYAGPIPNDDIGETTWRAQSDVTYFGSGANIEIYSSDYDPGNLTGVTKNAFSFDSSVGKVVKFDLNTTDANSTMVAYAATSYNTGWMHGDCKGAFLSDISTASVSAGSDLVTNGSFDTDSDWEKSSHWTISGGSATMPTTSSYLPLYTSADVFEVGKVYVVTVVVSAISGTIKVGSTTATGGGLQSDELQINSTGTHSAIIKPNASDETRFGIARLESTTTSVTVDSVTIFEAAEKDRSVNQNGLQVFGTVTKTAVATGAELVGYSGFTGSDYLFQPHNPDISFGASDDFSIILWVNGSNITGSNNIVDWGNGSDNTNRWVIYETGGNYLFYDAGTSRASSIAATDKWKQLAFVRQSGVLSIYGNGVLNATHTVTSSYDNTDCDLYIGTRQTLVDSWEGSIALLRISASAPSPEQIKKIYEDEKVLFQANAACTLYGTSDAVTALAYDEVTDQLHVGTSSGRSDFQGLRRINNTTTAVTTAISAHDSFIIEQ